MAKDNRKKELVIKVECQVANVCYYYEKSPKTGICLYIRSKKCVRQEFKKSIKI